MLKLTAGASMQMLFADVPFKSGYVFVDVVGLAVLRPLSEADHVAHTFNAEQVRRQSK